MESDYVSNWPFNCTLNKYKTEKILDIQCISLVNLITRSGAGAGRDVVAQTNSQIKDLYSLLGGGRDVVALSGQRIEM